MPQIFAIILAAGKGERAGGGVPKQFREFCGIPVFEHSINSFTAACSSQCRFVIVVPEVGDHAIDVAEGIITVRGGSTRFGSVKAALSALSGIAAPGDIIAVHDGARPLVSPQMIRRGIDSILEKGGGNIPFVEVTDSIRHIVGDTSAAVDRSEYVAVQTPQIFYYSEIDRAYSMSDDAMHFTDDASVYEAVYPGRINLYRGDPDNIKITNPADFAIAEVLMSRRRQ